MVRSESCFWLRFPRIFTVLLCLAQVAGPALATRAAAWPSFRGPNADGYAQGTGFPLTWSETNNVTWAREIPHRGWSTPAIIGKQVWLTTATLKGSDFSVLCLDADTGKVLVDQPLFHCENPEPLGNDVNGYATPSPAIWEGGGAPLVFVHFGSYGTACLNTETLATVWKREDLKCRHYRGPSSSPIIFKDTVILTFDGADLQYTVGLDCKTGKTLWKTDRSVPWNDENVPGQMARDGDLRKAHSTPIVVNYQGKPVLLTSGAKAAYGYDAASGKELWQVRHNCWSAAPVPAYQDGVAFFVTGSGKTELFAIRMGGEGNVTDTHIAWRYDSMVAKTASPILVDGRIYMVSDDGMLTCLDAKTGQMVWRMRLGGNYAASPLYAEGRLYWFDQRGKTTVIKPGPAFEGLATNSLPAGFMASPAVSGKALFLRTRTHVYRVEEKK